MESAIRDSLYEFAKELLRIEDYNEALDIIVQRSLTLLKGERGFLVLVQGGDVRFKVIRNWSQEEYEGGEEPISRSILLAVLSQKTPTLIEDAANDPRFQNKASVRKLFVRSVLASPLSVEGKVVGALYLESRSIKHFFGEKELELFAEILELSSRVMTNSMHRMVLEERLAEQERNLLAKYQFPGIVTKDAGFLRILETVAQVSRSDMPILIQGPSGTGKELIARALHLNSPRQKKPFLTINCSALSPTLLESELFGHVKGAFTGATQNKTGLIAAAHQGTLFLDEIGELPKELQAKLLRTLQFGEIQPVGSTTIAKMDVRFLAATNRDLEKEVKSKKFREDLLYRLNAVTIHLPPLKDRKDDILPLFYHFLKQEAAKNGQDTPEVSPKVERIVEAYSWPGNIRELENEAKRLIALTPPGMPITQDRLSEKLSPKSTIAPTVQNLEEQERELIELHLRLSGGNRTHAAESLGVSRGGLLKMMKRHGIE